MIDARDYETTEELADAMQFEHDISELEHLDKKLAELEVSFEFYKNQYELAMKALKSKQVELRKNIDEYFKKLRRNRK